MSDMPRRCKRSQRMEKTPPVWDKARMGANSNDAPIGVAHEIRVRNLRFELGRQEVGSWHPRGAQVACWFDAWSLFFPAGESFFIDSVRRCEDQLQSPELRLQARQFIAQEAMHGREHQRYNALLQEAGLPAAYLAKRVHNFFAWVARRTSPKTQLAITAGLEHITAIFAHSLLNDERLLHGSDPNYAALWWWHVIEEIEHKAVAFDVYEAVCAADRLRYARRAGAMAGISLAFAAAALTFHITLVTRSGHLADLRGWGSLLGFLFLEPGLLRRVPRRYLDYFRRDFHPWQYDDDHKLAQKKSLNLPAAAQSHVDAKTK